MRRKHIMGALALVLILCFVSSLTTITSDNDCCDQDITLGANSSATVGERWSYYSAFVTEWEQLCIDSDGGLDWSVSMPSWVSKSGSTFSGTPTTAGTYKIEMSVTRVGDNLNEAVETINITVSNPPTPTYTVSYNAIGGSPTPSSRTVDEGTRISIGAAPSKSGYQFDGWYTNSSYTGTKYQPNQSYTVNSNVTFYAKWNEVYSVTFNLTNLTLKSGSNTAVDGKYYLAQIEPKSGYELPNSISVTIGGRSVSGVYTASDGEIYISGTEVDGNIVVTASGVRQISYTVSFNANGGSTTPSSQTAISGKSITLPSSAGTRTGYTFAGWNTNSSGTGTTYAAGASYTVTSNTTLYAKWTAVSYTISFDNNGGSGTIANKSGTYEASITLPTSGITKTGYTLNGWNTSADGSGTHYNLGASYSITANATLYAEWEAQNLDINYRIILGESIDVSGKAVADNPTAKIKDVLEAVSDVARLKIINADYGYYLDAIKATQMSDNLTAAEISSSDVVYVIAVSYTYNLYDGDALVHTWNDYWAESDIHTTLSRQIESREGYTLTFKDSQNNIYTPDSGMAAFKHNENFYTVWTADKRSVTFDSNGGSIIESQEIDYNTTPVKPEDPTKPGFTFRGWYTDSALTIEYTFTIPVLEDITLYAKWNEDVVFESVPKVTDIVVSINDNLIRASLVAESYTYIMWNPGDGSEPVKTYTTDFEHSYETPGNYNLIAIAVNSVGESEPLSYNVLIEDSQQSGNDENNGSDYRILIILSILIVVAIIFYLVVKE